MVVLYYIYKKSIKYKSRKDHQIYKAKQLESTFIEIKQNNKSIVVGCIYHHPSMDLSDFNHSYLSPLLENLS